MYCLHCGDCCRRMSPIAIPCPFIIKIKNYVFCSKYNDRPKECKNHKFRARFCPIGLDVLKLKYPDDIDKIRDRIDVGDETLTILNINKEQ